LRDDRAIGLHDGAVREQDRAVGEHDRTVGQRTDSTPILRRPRRRSGIGRSLARDAAARDRDDRRRCESDEERGLHEHVLIQYIVAPVAAQWWTKDPTKDKR
jgi:hypothetical protein